MEGVASGAIETDMQNVNCQFFVVLLYTSGFTGKLLSNYGICLTFCMSPEKPKGNRGEGGPGGQGGQGDQGAASRPGCLT